jgi:hypothetical protein
MIPDAVAEAAPAPTTQQVCSSQLERLSVAQRRELARLRDHFHGAVRVQLKPLAHAIGIADRTVRNNGNRLRINGLEIMPASVCGRVTYDLEEVANALALSAIQAPPPARIVERKPPQSVGALPKGRSRKSDLSTQIANRKLAHSGVAVHE